MATESQELDSRIYTEEFFFTCNDGFQEFSQDFQLSRIKQKAFSKLTLRPGHRLLDVGCGRGEILLHAARSGAKVFGFDYSSAAVAIARQTLREFPSSVLARADAEHIPFRESFFDRVFLGDVIEHVGYGKGVRLLRQAKRSLKGGGLLLLHTSPNRLFMRWIYPWLKGFMNPAQKKSVEEHVRIQRRYHVHEYHCFSLARAAREAGLESAEISADPDLSRGGRFRHLQKMEGFQKWMVETAERWAGRFPFSAMLLSNDLWLTYRKP